MQHRATRRHGNDCQRVGHGLGGDSRAFERVQRDVDFGTVSGAHFLADVQHRRLVAFALADHHGTGDVHGAKLLSHRVHGGLVGGFLVAAADQRAAGKCSLFRHAGQGE